MVPVKTITVSVRGIFISLSLLLLITATVGNRITAHSPAIDNEERAMLKLINNYREQNGLGPLKISPSLNRAANWMSADMADKNYFRHIDSQGRNAADRMTFYGYDYHGTRGENLAAGFDDAARTFNQWKNSPGHNANMLNRTYNVIGIGREYGPFSKYKWYWTTDFGSYVDDKPLH